MNTNNLKNYFIVVFKDWLSLFLKSSSSESATAFCSLSITPWGIPANLRRSKIWRLSILHYTPTPECRQHQQWWVCRHFCLFPLCVADVHNSPPNLCDGDWYEASLTKRLTSLTMTQVFRMFHKSRDHFTNDCVLCTDSIQSIKDTLMTQWGRLGLVTVCVHCCSIFWWGIKHNERPCPRTPSPKKNEKNI